MKRVVLFSVLAVLATMVRASALSPVAHAEIAALLDGLARSDCEFYRNGSWYAGARAASHLQRKLDYLDNRDLVATADAFIALGASKSSMSGEVYQVRCPGEAAVPSAEWLNRKLAQIRAHAAESPDQASPARAEESGQP